tara:strand:+ start:178 stop:393 length:216 start_codon:yes stop_codon:yes gene_type:complete
MIAIRCRPSPVLVYASEKKRHKFAINSQTPVVKNKEIDKLKLIANWNLRATKSALKNCEEMVEILEELSTK